MHAFWSACVCLGQHLMNNKSSNPRVTRPLLRPATTIGTVLRKTTAPAPATRKVDPTARLVRPKAPEIIKTAKPRVATGKTVFSAKPKIPSFARGVPKRPLAARADQKPQISKNQPDNSENVNTQQWKRNISLLERSLAELRSISMSDAPDGSAMAELSGKLRDANAFFEELAMSVDKVDALDVLNADKACDTTDPFDDMSGHGTAAAVSDPQIGRVDSPAEGAAGANIPQAHCTPSQPAVDSTPSQEAVDSTPSQGAVDSTPSQGAVDSTPSQGAVDSTPIGVIVQEVHDSPMKAPVHDVQFEMPGVHTDFFSSFDEQSKNPPSECDSALLKDSTPEPRSVSMSRRTVGDGFGRAVFSPVPKSRFTIPPNMLSCSLQLPSSTQPRSISRTRQPTRLRVASTTRGSPQKATETARESSPFLERQALPKSRRSQSNPPNQNVVPITHHTSKCATPPEKRIIASPKVHSTRRRPAAVCPVVVCTQRLENLPRDIADTVKASNSLATKFQRISINDIEEIKQMTKLLEEVCSECQRSAEWQMEMRAHLVPAVAHLLQSICKREKMTRSAAQVMQSTEFVLLVHLCANVFEAFIEASSDQAARECALAFETSCAVCEFIHRENGIDGEKLFSRFLQIQLALLQGRQTSLGVYQDGGFDIPKVTATMMCYVERALDRIIKGPDDCEVWVGTADRSFGIIESAVRSVIDGHNPMYDAEKLNEALFPVRILVLLSRLQPANGRVIANAWAQAARVCSQAHEFEDDQKKVYSEVISMSTQ
eukprot:GHVO01009950.1.p1 GENE.GHVO01009950.1~~GHVO01009950.1.p1  ORF type:complete len:772 (+),score=78.68 GHVO01009950.1:836-3151(+)